MNKIDPHHNAAWKNRLLAVGRFLYDLVPGSRWADRHSLPIPLDPYRHRAWKILASGLFAGFWLACFAASLAYLDLRTGIGEPERWIFSAFTSLMSWRALGWLFNYVNRRRPTWGYEHLREAFFTKRNEPPE